MATKQLLANKAALRKRGIVPTKEALALMLRTPTPNSKPTNPNPRPSNPRHTHRSPAKPTQRSPAKPKHPLPSISYSYSESDDEDKNEVLPSLGQSNAAFTSMVNSMFRRPGAREEAERQLAELGYKGGVAHDGEADDVFDYNAVLELEEHTARLGRRDDIREAKRQREEDKAAAAASARRRKRPKHK